MIIEELTPPGANLALSFDELLIINNAINEVCHGLDLVDFHARIGATPEEAKALLRQIDALLNRRDRVPHPPSGGAR